eukprot:gnl/MRDRNA2_/MRDRNA2_82409_c0_seq1.p1 gnl/MRDRNA2_/MRDRNA2_82409_c0~~gnl/MRDRNA2_/MRDRNA2_82409_c0_seq1.p1  ORF type:complete len:288 (+),score=53.47 gnl/MRDRNA2_/MRDRNA2_82409_c0_seq1:115-864(+)
MGGAVVAGVSFLGQDAAIQVDVDLMSKEGGFSIDQLMELAGLSVACSIEKVYSRDKFSKVLVISGPGNNGGDGLVAARHLYQFGYHPTVVYPKMNGITAKNELYGRLVVQLRQLGVPVVEDFSGLEGFDLAVDTVFGFSFKGWRGGGKDAPYDQIVDAFRSAKIPVVAVDIPSGWNVEGGAPKGAEWQPDMLVSLTAPKSCARLFTGRHHYLGGRFVPPNIIEKYKLRLPLYPGAEQCVRLGPPSRMDS